MSHADHKALVRHFVEEAQSRGNLDAIEEYLAEDFVDHSPMAGFPPTREGVRMLFTALWTGFPDLHAVIHEQLAEGDRVMTRKTLQGTHRGAFFGVPPTAKPVAIEIIDILRVDGGKITDHWAVIDQLGMLRQIGLVPDPAAPPATA
jgi:steroid delta-isomerase-like uncharacterized protein